MICSVISLKMFKLHSKRKGFHVLCLWTKKLPKNLKVKIDIHVKKNTKYYEISVSSIFQDDKNHWRLHVIEKSKKSRTLFLKTKYSTTLTSCQRQSINTGINIHVERR